MDKTVSHRPPVYMPCAARFLAIPFFFSLLTLSAPVALFFSPLFSFPSQVAVRVDQQINFSETSLTPHILWHCQKSACVRGGQSEWPREMLK